MQFKIDGKQRILSLIFTFGFLLFFFGSVFAQNYTQTVKGRVIDQDTKAPIFRAKVFILNTSPTLGTTSDAEGYFSLEKVPIGRYDFKILYIGYEDVYNGPNKLDNFSLKLRCFTTP